MASDVKNTKKVSKTYSISLDVWEQFKEMTDEKCQNGSKLIEGWIKEYINENSKAKVQVV